MTSVIDLNVVLPLMLEQHPHRFAAEHWWEQCDEAAVLFTLPVRMGVLRLLTNRKVVGDGVLSPDSAWQTLNDILQDGRALVADDIPPGQSLLWRRFTAGRDPSPNLWTDAWLAAFAEATGSDLVTFDRGFRSFGLSNLTLLSAG